MNGKQAKRIRKAMLNGSGEAEYGFATSSSYYNQELHYKFVYHSIGKERLYKMGKKIFKKYGVLPLEQ